LDFPPAEKKKFATCLYTGLIYDTNNFSNKNVSPKTFAVASDLLECGVDNNSSFINIFDNKTTKVLKLLGMTLSTLELYEMEDKRKIAFYITTAKMLKKCDAEMKLTEDFSNEVKPTKEREVVAYFREINKDYFRVSLRSIDIDVEKIAEKFGGGGHKLAAGFETKMELEMLKNKLIKLVSDNCK